MKISTTYLLIQGHSGQLLWGRSLHGGNLNKKKKPFSGLSKIFTLFYYFIKMIIYWTFDSNSKFVLILIKKIKVIVVKHLDSHHQFCASSIQSILWNSTQTLPFIGTTMLPALGRSWYIKCTSLKAGVRGSVS